MEKGAPSCHPTRPTSRVRRAPRWLIEDGRNARAHSALDDDTSAYRMHVQREFPISSAASDVCACWAGQPHAVASTAIETVSHDAARRQQECAMKLSRTVGLAVDFSLLAATVAALAWISGAGSIGPPAD